LSFKDFTGRDLLKGSLFIKCIYDVTLEREGETSAILAGVFDYMFFYRANCTNSINGVQDPLCGETYAGLMGIDVPGVR
jgi:hypothetical protein